VLGPIGYPTSPTPPAIAARGSEIVLPGRAPKGSGSPPLGVQSNAAVPPAAANEAAAGLRNRGGAGRPGQAGRPPRPAADGAAGDGREAPGAPPAAGNPVALPPEERREVERLAQRDREVRNHEQAHAAVGGQHAGPPQYRYERGPDGRLYAVEGEVSIDVSPVPGNPEATLRKMEQVRRAALAPAQPSAQDRRIAALADRRAAEARREIAERAFASLLAGEIPDDALGLSLSPRRAFRPSPPLGEVSRTLDAAMDQVLASDRRGARPSPAVDVAA